MQTRRWRNHRISWFSISSVSFFHLIQYKPFQLTFPETGTGFRTNIYRYLRFSFIDSKPDYVQQERGKIQIPCLFLFHLTRTTTQIQVVRTEQKERRMSKIVWFSHLASTTSPLPFNNASQPARARPTPPHTLTYNIRWYDRKRPPIVMRENRMFCQLLLLWFFFAFLVFFSFFSYRIPWENP